MLLLACVTACPGREPGAASNCEAVADHIEKICGQSGQPDAENVRQIQCPGGKPLTITPEAAECVLHIKTCEEFAESDCIGHVTIGCEEQSDCPSDMLFCDVRRQYCAACLTDEDCHDNKGCADGLCWARDNAFFKLLTGPLSR